MACRLDTERVYECVGVARLPSLGQGVVNMVTGTPFEQHETVANTGCRSNTATCKPQLLGEQGNVAFRIGSSLVVRSAPLH